MDDRTLIQNVARFIMYSVQKKLLAPLIEKRDSGVYSLQVCV